MTDPTRLLDEGTELGKALLAAGTHEPSPPALRQKIHAAVLLGAVAAGVGTASTATAATKTSFLASLSVGKCVGIVAVGAVVSVGTPALVRSFVASTDHAAKVSSGVAPQLHARSAFPAAGTPLTPDVPRVPDLVVPQVIATSQVAALPAPRAREATTGSAMSAQPALEPIAVATALPAPSSSAFAASVPAEDDFASEVIVLDSSRAALAAGNFQAAVERLNRHDLDYPHGRLRPESLAVRIQAYAAKHDDVRVKGLVEQFLAQYPSHPFAVQAREIAGSAKLGR